MAAAADGAQINVAGARPEISTAQGGEELKLVLGEFSGPLDLLLYLIRQEQVSIYDIPLARITNAYLGYLRMMQGMDIAVASDFLVMAAQLIEIKSKMLLPVDPSLSPETAEADDPRRELIDGCSNTEVQAAAEAVVAATWSRRLRPRAMRDKSTPRVRRRLRPAARLQDS